MQGKQEQQKFGISEDKFTASFIGVAPVQNPEVVVLVTLYDPKGENGYQGGMLSAPVASNIMAKILPYLEN